jgi:hypothetical protein
MSHGHSWREPCVSTDRDRRGRWLWRLVRRKLRVKRVRRAKALARRGKSKLSFFAYAAARLNYGNRSHATLHGSVSPPPDANFKTPVLGKRDTPADRITLELRTHDLNACSLNYMNRKSWRLHRT